MLPVGLVTSDGQLHRSGAMRLATALDEIEPLGDERVRRNEAYFGLLLLARVVTRLGPFAPLQPEIVAALPAADYAYLQSVYAAINTQAMTGSVALPLTGPFTPSPPPPPASGGGPTVIETECPHCGAVLELNLQDDAL